MRFSQRNGYSPIRSALQIESIDDALRNSLWNVLQVIIWDTHKSSTPYFYTKDSNIYHFISAYWGVHFKKPIDQIPKNVKEAISAIREYFFSCEWYEIFDFLEFTSRILGKSQANFISHCNHVLERELSGYRILGDQIIQITSNEEISSIEKSLTNTTKYAGANTHLRRAVELLSDRAKPDYRNSIKESISAVESVVQTITGNSSATLGAALKVISQTAPMHPALNRSLSMLYGYTSDSDGIRHALLDESNLDFIDAKFMLVACSAFVNYLVGKSV